MASEPASSDRESAEDSADLLARVPLLAGLEAPVRAKLAEGSERVALRAGEWLFREGDDGDALYIISSGRLEAVASDGETIRDLTRDDAVGELALLTGEPRSASVRARRDSELLRIGRDFFAIAIEDGAFAAALMRGLGNRLRESRGVPAGSPGPPAVVALVGLGGDAPAQAVAAGLRDRIAAWSSVALLAAPEPEDGDSRDSRRSRYAELLDSAERTSDRVLLLAEDVTAGDDWSRFCLDQADRVVAIAAATGSATGIDALAGCELVLCGASAETTTLLEALDPPAIHAAPPDDGFGPGLDRMARRLSGRSVGVVLSGGGARGFAHIGALDVLLEAGVTIDRVAGCSMGAYVGGLFASGRSPAEITAICRAELVEQNPFNDYTLPIAALIRRQKGVAMLRRLFGDRAIEQFPLSYFCVSSDLVAGELVAHTRGDPVLGIGASMNIPGISPPLPHDGRLLVDGGVLNNLPVDVMAATGEGPVIAIDVTARYEPHVGVSRRPRARALQERFRALVIGDPTPVPAFPETLMRTLVLGSIDTAETAQQFADLVIEPDVSTHALMAFEELDDIVEKGRAAAARALESEDAGWLASPIGADASAAGVKG